MAECFLFETGWDLGAVPLFAAAFFTKQGQFYGLAAVLLTLGAESEFRRAFKLGVAWLLVTGSVLITLVIVFPWYWLNSFTGLAPFLDLTAPFSFIAQDIFEHAALFLLAAITLSRARWNLAGWFFLAALLENFVTALRWGSAPYYFLPTIAASAILGSTALDWFFAWTGQLAKPARLGFALFAAVAFCSGLIGRAVHTSMKMDFAMVPIQRPSAR